MYLVLGLSKLESGNDVVTVSDYKAEVSSDYKLCDLNKKFDYNSFQGVEYWYEFNNL